MKLYFAFIKHTQSTILALSIVILCTLPSALVLVPDWFTESTYVALYAAAHGTLFLVMLVRPLADILHGVPWLRPLVILRKGFGLFSASIIVSFILAKVMTDAGGYFGSFLTTSYWSLAHLSLLAHLADISAVLLLVTSNNFSKQILGKSWKHIQRLSYVYFYGSSLYVFFILGETLSLYYLIIITLVTVLAWLRNRGFILKA